MIATGEEICTVYVGSDKPNIFKYWTYRGLVSKEDFQKESRYLETVRWKGFGYGYAYYYSGTKIWFRKERDLTMYLLKLK